VIGVDVDPVACFVTKKQIEPFAPKLLTVAYQRLADAVESDIRRLYQTVDPLTGKKGEVANIFWVTRLQCGRCRRSFDAHPHFRLAYDSDRKRQEVFCRKCGRIQTLPLRRKKFECSACRAHTDIENGHASKGFSACPRCGYRERIRFQVKSGRPLRKRLFAVEYTVEGDVDPDTGKVRRHLKRATRVDIERFREASRLLRTEARRLRYPRAAIFRRRRYDPRPISYGFSRYAQLFNSRQLYCLARIYSEIMNLEDTQTKEYLLLALSDCLAANNQLVGYAFGYRKASPLFGIHGYHVVQRPVEGNVWGNPHFGRASFTRCVAKLVFGKEYAGRPFEYAYSRRGDPIRVYTGETVEASVAWGSSSKWKTAGRRALLLNRSSVDLGPIRDGSVDLILTDPPFYNNLPYSELSDFYYQWLRPWLKRFGTQEVRPVQESLFVRRKSRAEHARYVTGLTAVLQECARVLSQSGLLVFTFHHRDPSAWHALGSGLIKAGFRVTGVSPVRAEGVSGFHSYKGTPKWDSVISCRLTRPAPSQAAAGVTRMVETACHAERDWMRVLRDESICLAPPDRASLALSVALREGVNSRVSDRCLADLLAGVRRRYPQKGVYLAIPGVTPTKLSSAS